MTLPTFDVAAAVVVVVVLVLYQSCREDSDKGWERGGALRCPAISPEVGHC